VDYPGMDLMVDDFDTVGKHVRFPPDLMERPSGGADQPVETVVETVPFPVPGRTLAPRQGMHLDDLGIVAVHTAVDAGPQAGHPPADDDDFLGFIAHFSYASTTLMSVVRLSPPTSGHFPPERTEFVLVADDMLTVLTSDHSRGL